MKNLIILQKVLLMFPLANLYQNQYIAFYFLKRMQIME